MTIKLVDAHFHFWDLSMNKHPWLCGEDEPQFFLGAYDALKKNFLPSDYQEVSQKFEITKLIHCEAEWDRQDQVGETNWLEELYQQTGWPNALVAHAWLDDPRLEEILEQHCQSSLMRGIRSKPVTSLTPMDSKPQGKRSLQDPAWQHGYGLLAKFGLRYDLRVPCWHLAEAKPILSKHDDIPVVVNHLGFPWDRSEEGLNLWRTNMREIAQLPFVHLKISELGLKDQPWRLEDNRRVILEALDIFGVERCMWASNYPVAGLRIGYQDQVEKIKTILNICTDEERHTIFHDNAIKFYDPL